MKKLSHLFYDSHYPWVKEMNGRYYDADQVDDLLESIGKLCELIQRLESIGHTFVAIHRSDDELYTVYAHNPKEAQRLVGSKPRKEFCRDAIDFQLSLKLWRDKGTYLLYADKDLETAIVRAFMSIPVPK